MLGQQVGQPKYIHKQHYDFDLDYPLYARPGEYDSLHDPFLRNYFGKPRTKQLLVHNDLITKDGKVKCDIKEFNQYRSVARGVSLVVVLLASAILLMKALTLTDNDKIVLEVLSCWWFINESTDTDRQ